MRESCCRRPFVQEGYPIPWRFCMTLQVTASMRGLTRSVSRSLTDAALRLSTYLAKCALRLKRQRTLSNQCRPNSEQKPRINKCVPFSRRSRCLTSKTRSPKLNQTLQVSLIHLSILSEGLLKSLGKPPGSLRRELNSSLLHQRLARLSVASTASCISLRNSK